MVNRMEVAGYAQRQTAHDGRDDKRWKAGLTSPTALLPKHKKLILKIDQVYIYSIDWEETVYGKN